MSVVDAIDALLPQTQCGECQFPGCKPYAMALASKLAPIDRCPPGGVKTLRALGALLNIDPSPYEADMAQKTRAPSIAVIDEPACIGCTKCITACPVDAIVGAGKFMHTVIETECTGCGLCVAPCPVDCITMVPIAAAHFDPEKAKRRHHEKIIRDLKHQQQKAHSYQTQKHPQDIEAKQAYILQALERTKAKKSHE